MAINKKFIHFNKREDFDKELSAGNILDTSIVFIKDTREVYTHKWGIKSVPEGGTEGQILKIDSTGNMAWASSAEVVSDLETELNKKFLSSKQAAQKYMPLTEGMKVYTVTVENNQAKEKAVTTLATDISLMIDAIGADPTHTAVVVSFEGFSLAFATVEYTSDSATLKAVVSDGVYTLTLVKSGASKLVFTDTDYALKENFWSGTPEEYEELEDKDEDTFYFIVEEGGSLVYLTIEEANKRYVLKDGTKGLSQNDYTNEDKEKVTNTPSFWSGTQDAYDELQTKNSSTLYLIEEE